MTDSVPFFSFIRQGNSPFPMEKSDQKRSAKFSFLMDSAPFLLLCTWDSKRLCSFFSLPYLIVELSVPDGELWPEKEHKLLIHDILCSFFSLPFLVVELSITYPLQLCSFSSLRTWDSKRLCSFFSLPYLVVELSNPSRELWLKDECNLLIHDGHCSLLLFQTW